jgi:predicted acetyltransferase
MTDVREEKRAEQQEAEDLRLMRPTAALEKDFYRMVEDYRAVGEVADRMLEPIVGDFTTYLRRIRDFESGSGLPLGRVPQTTYWLVRNERTILAMSRLRHRLNSSLMKEGGHIGYTVRPPERSKGYGARICAEVIEQARKTLTVDRLLITCDTDNIHSARIIQKNGGVFENEVISDFTGKPVSRYWVTL